MATYNESTGVGVGGAGSSMSGTLPFYNQGLQSLLQAGQQQALKPYQEYTGNLLAGTSPLQQQAYDLAGGNVGNYQPLFDQSQQAFQASQTGAQFDPNQVQQYLNPYMTGVVDEIGRLGQEQFQQNVVPTLSNAFGGLGQFGSARQAAMLADASGRSQREILGAQSNALNTGYNNAMDQYFNWGQLGTQANQAAGAAYGNLGQATQQAGLTDYGTLASAGQSQQQQEQKGLDIEYAKFQQAQQYPWQQLQNWGGLFQSGTPQASTSVNSGNTSTNSSWSTNFKKGGLARYADGGRFSGDPLSIDPLAELMRPSTMSRSSIPNPSALVDKMPLIQDRPVAEKIGEAMMRAGAQGPANLGQFVGRAGTSYLDQNKEMEQENFIRQLKKNELLEEMSRNQSIRNSYSLSKFGKILIELGYTPGTPEFQQRLEEMIKEDKENISGELSVAGKIARDEGLKYGTPEYNARVKQLVEFEQDVKSRGLDIRQDTAGTYAGNLGARRQQQEAEYGALPPVGGSPRDSAPARQPIFESRPPVSREPAGIGPSGELPEAKMVGSEDQIMRDLASIADPVERRAAAEAYERSKAEDFSRHPGVLKYINQGLPIKGALERFELEGKEYDKIRADREESASPLSMQDFERAAQLNEQIHKEMGPGTGAWYSIPGAADIVSSLPTKHGAAVGELRALGTKMVPLLTKGLSPVSNADMQAMAKAGFGPELGYATNKATIERAKSALLLFKEQDEFYNIAQEMGLSPSQAKVEWNRYIKANPLFDLERTSKTGVLHYKTDPSTRPEKFQSYVEKVRGNFFNKVRNKKFSTTSPVASPRQAETSDNSGSPKVGQVINGYEYLGGNPNSQDSWRRSE